MTEKRFKCKDCEKKRIRIMHIQAGRKYNKDGSGKYWNGRQCPICHGEVMKHKNRERRRLERVKKFEGELNVVQ